MDNKQEFYRCHSIIEKDGMYYEIISVDANQQSYHRFKKEGATNAFGKVTNQGAICNTLGKVGYIKKLMCNESAFHAAFGLYNLVKEPDYSKLK